jgi:hypothetical protein
MSVVVIGFPCGFYDVKERSRLLRGSIFVIWWLGSTYLSPFLVEMKELLIEIFQQRDAVYCSTQYG